MILPVSVPHQTFPFHLPPFGLPQKATPFHSPPISLPQSSLPFSLSPHSVFPIKPPFSLTPIQSSLIKPSFFTHPHSVFPSQATPFHSPPFSLSHQAICHHPFSHSNSTTSTQSPQLIHLRSVGSYSRVHKFRGNIFGGYCIRHV